MDQVIREQLVSFLTTAQAHMTVIEAVADFPVDRMNEFPKNIDYSPWMLLEHIRRTQKDIVDFLLDSSYKEPVWPDEYWPSKDVTADKKMWDETVNGYKVDNEKLVKLAKNPKIDLSAKVENGNGQTVIREILLVIDHNSYHIGEFGILRQIMGTWPKGHK